MKRGQLLRRLAAVEPVSDFLLDEFPGAAAAFSLRKLRSDYTGAAIRVRRDSDDAEQDIGFNANGDFNETELSNFLSGANAFVTKIYDQSGNGFDHEQTNDSIQPIIASNNDLLSGKIHIFNNRTSNGKGFERSGSFLNNGEVSVFSVTSYIDEGNGVPMIFDAAQGSAFASSGSLRIDYFNNNRLGTYNGIGNGELLQYSRSSESDVNLRIEIATNSKREAYNNSVLLADDNITGGVDFSRTSQTNIFGYEWSPNTELIQGWEIIIYNNDQSTNRVGIENNINTYYNVF